MARLSFCVDEHVPTAFVTALRSNGFTVTDAVGEHGQETVDEQLLTWCGEQGYTLVTNDRDFVALDDRTVHAGVICYTSQDLTPGEFARGIRRIDRQFSPDSMDDTFVWLDEWV